MTSSGIFGLTALAAGSVQNDDALCILDVHDTTQSANGSTKKVLLSSLFTVATLTTSKPFPSVAQTWNAGAVTFTATLVNVTDSASAAGSLLADWQVGGVSKASVKKDGTFTGLASLTTLAVSGTSTLATTNFSKRYGAAQQTLTDGATVAIDWSNGNTAILSSPAAARTFTFTGAVAGDRGVLDILSSGAVLHTWPASVAFVGGGGTNVQPTATSAVGRTDLFGWYYNGTKYIVGMNLNA